ncbi:MAG: polysaccharide biosynthesis protein [Odoribacteraceae bacterium]|jgi:FlaA1/EpsC-like NDP-sugar epimerase|nr:polysaccharide biosynthesis protein [Odoribacteraceae bacterium]
MNALKNNLKAWRFSPSTPRWIVFIIDVIFSGAAIALAFILLHDFYFNRIPPGIFYRVAGLIIFLRSVSFLIGRTYASIVRYTGITDILHIFYILTWGSLLFCLLNILYYLIHGHPYVSFSVLCIEYLLLINVMIVSRLLLRWLFMQSTNNEKGKKNVIIYGSDDYALMAKSALDKVEQESCSVVGFIDSNGKMSGKILKGVKVYAFSSLKNLLIHHKVNKVIIAQKSFTGEKKRILIETCLQHDVSVLEVPRFEKWINGELSMHHIKNVKIEDLLERGEIQMNKEKVRRQLLNKVVMVTGAAGSIGSEIVRQLVHFHPASIVLFDQAESPLHEMELELKSDLHFERCHVEMGDVRDRKRVEEVFKLYKPDIVYHAAAYKHVPMVEMHPVEGVKTNVMGTKNVADLAVKHGCDVFVMISTDKAVNPTNVMGASKRVAEIYTQSFNQVSSTRFITTRFGNVLGSSGSVIPRFKKQIEEGGPVTVTDPEITRFFMTIPEACRLVLQASVFGQGGEIFVFEMGESVKIVDLARKMIKLYGLQIGKDIQIKFTGLRPGEKLYEEMLNLKETTLPTVHERIKIAKVREYKYEEVAEWMERLDATLREQDNKAIVKQMKYMVPEFKSQNSPVYEAIDIQIENEKEMTHIHEIVDADTPEGQSSPVASNQ